MSSTPPINTQVNTISISCRCTCTADPLDPGYLDQPRKSPLILMHVCKVRPQRQRVVGLDPFEVRVGEAQ